MDDEERNNKKEDFITGNNNFQDSVSQHGIDNMQSDEEGYSTALMVASYIGRQLDSSYIEEISDSVEEFERLAEESDISSIGPQDEIIKVSQKISEISNRYYGDPNVEIALNRYYEATDKAPNVSALNTANIISTRYIRSTEEQGYYDNSQEKENTNAHNKQTYNNYAEGSTEKNVAKNVMSGTNKMDLDSQYLREVSDSIKQFENTATKVNKVDTAKSQLIPLGAKIRDVYAKYYGNGSFHDALEKYYSLTKKSPSYHVASVENIVDAALRVNKASSKFTIIENGLRLLANNNSQGNSGSDNKAKGVGEVMSEYVSSGEQQDIMFLKRIGLVTGEATVKLIERRSQIKKVKPQSVPVNVVISNLESKAMNAYVTDMLPYYEKYLSAVAVSDVMNKYGKEASVDNNLKADIVTLYKKHFGAESKEDVGTIIRNFEETLKKQNPALLQQLKAKAQEQADKVQSSIIANVKIIDASKMNVAVKEAQNAGQVIQAGAKSNLMISANQHIAQLQSSGLFGAVDLASKFKSRVSNNYSKNESSVNVSMEEWKKRVKEFPSVAKDAVQVTKGTVKTTQKVIQASKTIAQVAVKAVSFLVKGIMEAIGEISVVAGPVIIIVLFVVVILMMLFPTLLYGGLTHLSNDIAMNETYAYITLKRTDALASPNGDGYYDYVYSTTKDVPKTLISNPSIEETQPGYIYTGYNPADLKYLNATDPLAYISLLSSYYTEFSFPQFFYNNPSTGSQILEDVRTGAGLMNFDDFYASSIQKVDGTTQKASNFDKAINQLSVQENKAELLKFLYTNWWQPARKLKVQEELLAAAQEEAQIRKQLGLDTTNANTVISNYILLQSNPDFLKYFGPAQKDNFKAIVAPNKQIFDKEIDKLITMLGNYSSTISSVQTNASNVVRLAFSGYFCNTVIVGYDPSSGQPIYDCSCEVSYGNTSAIISMFQQIQNGINNHKNNLIKYKKDVDDLYDKLANEFMKDGPDAPPWWPQWMQDIYKNEVPWYSESEIKREIDLTSKMESQFVLVRDEIKNITNEINGIATNMEEAVLSLNGPTNPDCCCVGAWSANMGDLAKYKGDLSNSVQNLKSINNQFKQEITYFEGNIMKEVITSYAKVTMSTPYTELTDNDLQDINSIAEKTVYKNFFKDNNLAIYILKNILTPEKASSDSNYAMARSSFLQVYNPYGMLFKEELDPGGMDINSMVYKHHIGYFYDHMAKALNVNNQAKNPRNEPDIFTASGLIGTVTTNPDNPSEQIIDVDETIFFTTQSYVRSIIGIKVTRPGFLDRTENWINEQILYKGDVITSPENAALLSTGEDTDSSSYSYFTVFAPLAGELRKASSDPNDNTLVLTIETESSNINMDSQEEGRLLVKAITLRGVTLDPSIAANTPSLSPDSSHGVDIESGSEIGKAKVLYIDYSSQEDEYYVLLGGHWIIPRDLNFYREPSLYFMLTESSANNPSGG